MYVKTSKQTFLDTKNKPKPKPLSYLSLGSNIPQKNDTSPSTLNAVQLYKERRLYVHTLKFSGVFENVFVSFIVLMSRSCDLDKNIFPILN